jgi:hypothetical protein
VNTVMNLRVPQNVGKFLNSCMTGGLSRRAQFMELVFFVGWDLRHQVLRPLVAYCTAPDDR